MKGLAMKPFRFLSALLGFSLLFGLVSPSVRAESETELLRKEVRELKKTVDQLSVIVNQQNKKIDHLSGEKVAAPQIMTPQKPGDSSTDLKPVETVQKKEKTPKPATVAAESAPKDSGDREVQSLLNSVNNAPPLPGAQSRTVGLWKYPTGASGAAKILPDISVIGIFAGSYFSKDPRGDTGPNPARTGFTFQELELALTGTVDPYFKYDAFLSFSEDGVEAEEAYFTTLAGPPKGMQFRGGKFLLPFGRQNQKHLHAWAFADNNLVNNDFFGPDTLGELGLELAYLFPTPFFMQIQGDFTNTAGDASFGGKGKGEFLYNGRLTTSFDINDDLTMLIGSSGAFGFNDSGTGIGQHTSLVGGDLLLKWKPSSYSSLVWQTEYIFRSKQFSNNTANDGGLYSYLDYQFYKQFHAGFRYDQMGIPSGQFNNEYRLTPAFTYNPTEFSQIRVQYEYDKKANFAGTHAAILQLMFNLGVHGAHLF